MTLSLLCCLKHFTSASSISLRSGFRNRYSLEMFCSIALIILILFFQIVWIVYFTKPNPATRQLSFFHFLFLVSLFFRHSKPMLLVTVAMLSFYQSPIKWSTRKVDENIKHFHSYYFHYPGLEFIQLPAKVQHLSSQGAEEG